MEKYDFSPEDANSINSLVYIISAIASPLFGFVIDKTGRNVSWMLLSILVTIGSHSFLAFTFANPYVCMVSNSFSLYSKIIQLIYTHIISDLDGSSLFNVSEQFMATRCSNSPRISTWYRLWNVSNFKNYEPTKK